MDKPTSKQSLHPRNRFQGRYHFPSLCNAYPSLKEFAKPNKYGDLSIDFFNPNAVKALNQALLYKYYKLDFWDLPDGNLCPAIPGRADYVHYLADLLEANGINPNSRDINCLDIGVGANCIYPIIGVMEYGWNCLGVDINEVSINAAQFIVKSNPALRSKIGIRKQSNPKDIFQNILEEKEYFHVTVCNPPFFESEEDVLKSSKRKMKNISRGEKKKQLVSNFQGKSNELWCEGGERQFISDMIMQSRAIASQVGWFSTLVSKEAYKPFFNQILKRAKVTECIWIPMGQGNKKTRILAWRY